MLNAGLGKPEGFDHRFSEDFGLMIERKTQGSREASVARDCCDTHGSWAARQGWVFAS
jgi:hypothetical protein